MTFVPTITQIQNFPEVDKGSEHAYTYYIENSQSLIHVYDMSRELFTNQQRGIRHLSVGETDKYFRY